MNHEAAELAALRLAPVQCSYIGHPQTSGYPTIDCFLSGELIEPPDGAEHYSEKLVRLPNIAFHYEPLELAAVRGDAGRSWACAPPPPPIGARNRCSSICRNTTRCFRASPREVGDCQFVFIRHFGREVTELFQQRLDRAFAAHGLKAADHCVFLDAMSMSRFAAASAQCDVMLDSIGWSGGNTTLEALAQDLPVVTFEGELMRGRVSAGMLRMMGMPETVAGDDRRLRRARACAWPGTRPGAREIKARVARDRAAALSRPHLHRRAGRIPRTRRARRHGVDASRSPRSRPTRVGLRERGRCWRCAHACRRRGRSW